MPLCLRQQAALARVATLAADDAELTRQLSKTSQAASKTELG
jgi:hypothetical protein